MIDVRKSQFIFHSSGFAVITSNKQALWTDGRYFLEAEDTLDCNWILMRERKYWCLIWLGLSLYLLLTRWEDILLHITSHMQPQGMKTYSKCTQIGADLNYALRNLLFITWVPCHQQPLNFKGQLSSLRERILLFIG